MNVGRVVTEQFVDAAAHLRQQHSAVATLAILTVTGPYLSRHVEDGAGFHGQQNPQGLDGGGRQLLLPRQADGQAQQGRHGTFQLNKRLLRRCSQLS